METQFPNVARDAGHYESFYLKATHPSEPRSVWIRHTVWKAPGAEPVGSLWCTLFDASWERPVAFKRSLPAPTAQDHVRIGDDGKAGYRESKARMKAAEAAIERVETLREEEWVRTETADRVRQLYDYRRRRFKSRFYEDGTESEEIEVRSVAYQRLLHELYDAQRAAIVALRNEGRITDEIMHRIERDLVLEESRLEI